MRLRTKADIASSSGIIHSLSSCPIGRAAELLGCDIADILHLEETEKVTLYFNFKEPKLAITTPAWFGLKPEFDYLDVGLTNTGDSFLTLGAGAYAGAGPLGALTIDAIESLGDDAAIPVWISGMWSAYERYKMKWNDSSEDYSDRVTCCGGSGERIQMKVAIPGRWDVPPTDELHMMNDDLVRLYEAITQGKPLDIAGINKESKPKTRESDGPFIAIVELLQSLGFKSDDLIGSAQKLQTTIGAKGYSDKLAAIDPKTLREWLSKGGARKIKRKGN